MPPASLDGVVHCAQSLTLRTAKTFPWHVLESQLQAFGFTFKAALGYSPLPTQSKRCSKEFFGRHRFNFSRLQAEMQIAFGAAAKSLKLLRSAACGEERAKGCRTQNTVTLLSASLSLVKIETK